MTYLRLGDYIREVNVRNRELKVTNLVGLTIDKAFIPSVANVIGTDLSNYKVICREQFACSLMQVSRDGKMPVAMFEEDEAIMSPAYPMFEVVDKTKLLPQYLMMWFSRSEFDREASYYAVGGVRGSLTWEDFCNMQLPVPSINRQREIVSEYETLTRRIRLNEQMIKKLEATAQALYRKMFGNLKSKIGYFTDLIKISGGGTPDTSTPSYWNGDIPFFTPADICFSCYCIETEKHLTQDGVSNCSSKIYPKDTTFVTSRGTVGGLSLAGMDMAMNQSCYALLPRLAETPFFIYCFTKDVIVSLKEESVGAVFNALVTRDFETKEVTIPPTEMMIQYNDYAKPIFKVIYLQQNEISKLAKLQSLLLAKTGQ